MKVALFAILTVGLLPGLKFIRSHHTREPEACGAHGICNCTTKGRGYGDYIICDDKNLTEVPRGIPLNTTTLRLARNNLSTLGPDSFKGLPNLYKLDLTSSHVLNISKEIFHGMNNLSKLLLTRNNITSLPVDVFSEIALSDKLDISYNYLRELPSGLFASGNITHELNVLYLQHNSIEVIRNNTFAGLYRIKYILLFSNKIHTLQDGAFVDIGAAEIYLFGNKLTKIDGNPFDNENISEVHLYGNTIETVSEKALEGLKGDIKLYLNCEHLTETPWAAKHIVVKCVSPSFVPTLHLPRASLHRALIAQGFNCTHYNGSTQCQPCRPGTSGDGLTGCYPCPAGGFYQDDIGQAASVPGGMACKECNAGTYVKNGSGSSIAQCQVCPEGTNRMLKARFRACLCKDNYSRTHRFGPCELCLEEGLNCTSEDFKSLLPGYFWNWTFPTANFTEYVQFVQNLQDESRFYKKLYIKYPYDIPKVHKCQRPTNCRNNGKEILERIKGTCEEGYRGWMCSKCKTGYYSVLNSCVSCPRKVLLITEVLGIFALCVVFYFAFLSQYKRQKRQSSERSFMNVIVSRSKIVLGFYQVVGELITSLHNVNWTGALRVVGEAINLVELSVLRLVFRPQCFDSNMEINPKIEFIIGTSLPVVIIAIGIVYYNVRKYCVFKSAKGGRLQNDQLYKVKNQTFTVIFVLLFITYPPICSSIFQLYPRACQTFCLDHNNKHCMRRLRSDFDIDCSDLYLYHVLAYVATVIYIIAFPMALLALLRKCFYGVTNLKRDGHLSESGYTTSVCEQYSLLNDTPETTAVPVWLNFLCENYKPQFWYWEIIELSRKVTQTMLITLLGWEDKVTVLLTIATSVLFLTLHARFWPMKDLFDQRLQMFSLTAIFINVLVAAMAVPASYEGTINTMLILLNILVILIIAAEAMLSLLRHMRKIGLWGILVRFLRHKLVRISQRRSL